MRARLATTAMNIEITILGSGTSTGVPMLGCACEACTSADPRDQRFRASILLRWAETSVVVDATPEFRLQMLRAGVPSLDALILTHNHADHVGGLDDLRQYTMGSSRRIPVYGPPEALCWVRHRFGYIWDSTQVGGGLPQIDLVPVVRPFALNGVTIVPVPVLHGVLRVYGYRIGDFAYLSDVSAIPERSMRLLAGLDLLVVDAVRYRPHRTHFNLEQAMAVSRRLGARRTLFTHMNHDFLHRKLAAELPDGMAPAYDGQVVRVQAPGMGWNSRRTPISAKRPG